MENPASWTKAEWIVHDALEEAAQARARGVAGLSTTRLITSALQQAGLLRTDLPALGVFLAPPQNQDD